MNTTNRSRQKYIIMSVLALAAFIALGIVVHYFTSTVPIKISFVNVKSVTITESADDTSTPKTISTIAKSPATVRVAKNSTQSANYTGTDDYADGSITIDKTKPEISIDPDYSDEKYQALMDEALPKVSALLQKKYPTLDSLYAISSAQMKQKGVWYVVRLDFRGDYSENSDTLRALFKKDGSSWQLVAGPDILFTTVQYQNVDPSILKWANEAFTE